MKRLFLLCIPLMLAVLAACSDPLTAAQYALANGR